MLKRQKPPRSRPGGFLGDIRARWTSLQRLAPESKARCRSIGSFHEVGVTFRVGVAQHRRRRMPVLGLRSSLFGFAASLSSLAVSSRLHRVFRASEVFQVCHQSCKSSLFVFTSPSKRLCQKRSMNFPISRADHPLPLLGFVRCAPLHRIFNLQPPGTLACSVADNLPQSTDEPSAWFLTTSTGSSAG